jgi:hypothetical protein
MQTHLQKTPTQTHTHRESFDLHQTTCARTPPPFPFFHSRRKPTSRPLARTTEHPLSHRQSEVGKVPRLLTTIPLPSPRPPISPTPILTPLLQDDYWDNVHEPVNPGGNQPPWGYCTYSPIGGPSEIQLSCVEDMALAQADVDALHSGWQALMGDIYSAMDTAGAYAYASFTFSSTPGPGSVNATLAEVCAAGTGSSLYNVALMHSLTSPAGCCPPNRNTTLTQFHQDLAYFMLVRAG